MNQLTPFTEKKKKEKKRKEKDLFRKQKVLLLAYPTEKNTCGKIPR